MPEMLSRSTVENSRVTALVGLKIQVGHGALPMDEELVVLSQPLRPQVPIEVDRILSMVVYSSYLQKEIIIQIQKHMI